MRDTINSIEVVWAYWSIQNGAACTLLAWDVVQDIRSRELMKDSVLKDAAWLCVGITLMMVTTMAVFLMIAVVAMTQPQQTGSTYSVAQIAITVGLFAVSTVMFLVAIWWRLLRRKARRTGKDAIDVTARVVSGDRND